MSSNPALNPKIFQKETKENNPGAFTPGWAAPGQGVPPTTFGPPGQGAYGAPGYGPPAYGQPTAPPPGYAPPAAPPADTMRMSGTMSATAILLGILVVAGWFGWQSVTVLDYGKNADGSRNLDVQAPSWLMISVIVGFVIAIVTVFKPKIARFTAPLYAVAEGLFLGAVSQIFEAYFPGIVIQAVLLTIGVFMMMLILFATGTVKVTDKMRTGIIAATGAVCLVYLVSIVAQLFGSSVPMIHDAGPVGIGFSLLVVGIAAMNLLLDFSFIQQAVALRAPRYMEWFGAFGLLITLVWLYLELLKLLAKLRSR